MANTGTWWTGTKNVISGKTIASKKHLGIISKRFCKRCNNGWMSDLETDVKPQMAAMMRGSSITIAPSQQIQLSRWLVKTAMAIEFTNPRAKLFFEPRERRLLAEKLQVPAATLIFLARYMPRPGVVPVPVRTREGDLPMFFPLPDGGEERTNGHIVTILIGQVALQLFTLRRTHAINRLDLSLANSGDWRDTTTQIYPTLFERAWPPRLALDDDGFIAFHNRWTTTDRT
jgi:hypothetical protein